MISLMVFFSGLIAFGSVLNAALVSLSERTREVGTLRVLGYAPGQAWAIFGGESALLNGVGIVLGLFAGIGLSYGMSQAYSTELYRFPTVIYASSLLLSGILMVVIMAVAQLIVYRLVRKLEWLKVLAAKE
jgi:putative ABC transport system permease protein